MQTILLQDKPVPYTETVSKSSSPRPSTIEPFPAYPDYGASTPGHLSEKDAITAYIKAKTDHPDALTILEALDCGHWNVKTYLTDREREEFLRQSARHLISRVLDMWAIR